MAPNHTDISPSAAVDVVQAVALELIVALAERRLVPMDELARRVQLAADDYTDDDAGREIPATLRTFGAAAGRGRPTLQAGRS